MQILESMKTAGNVFYKRAEFVEACRKYKKTVRYFNFLKDKLEKTNRNGLNILQLRESLQPIYQINTTASLNIAACELKLSKFVNTRNACDEVLLSEPKNAKALYRRGQAQIELKNYDDAIKDLELANRLLPNDKNVQKEFERAKAVWRNYNNEQKIVYKDLFERI